MGVAFYFIVDLGAGTYELGASRTALLLMPRSKPMDDADPWACILYGRTYIGKLQKLHIAFELP